MTTHFQLIVMGVSGCGKSTVAEAIAKQLAYRYIDGDDFHPKANIEKMQKGQPLNDEDRQQWLEDLNQLLAKEPEGVVLACSALKPHYRQTLAKHITHPIFVYLKGDFETIWERHKQRQHHFFNGQAMLKSQFETLVEPTGNNVITADVRLSIEEIVDFVTERLAQLA